MRVHNLQKVSNLCHLVKNISISFLKKKNHSLYTAYTCSLNIFDENSPWAIFHDHDIRCLDKIAGLFVNNFHRKEDMITIYHVFLLCS